MKLCIIYNFAQHYRTNIFTLIDQEFSCDWLFGDSMGDVKKMDYNLLHGNITETHTKRLFGGWYWQPGVISKLKQNYTHYILLGESRALSTWVFCILARLFYRKKKVYFWSHGWYGKETCLERIIKKMEFILPNGGIFTYGNYARNLMIKEGFDPDRLYTIYNSLAYDKHVKIRSQLVLSDVYTSYFNNQNKILLFVGRLSSVKKLDMVLLAVAELRMQKEMYNLIFIGDGDEREHLQSLCRELKLEDVVWFYGACYDETVLANLIYNADLCISPGNVGLTAMHCMSFGLPVATHNKFEYQMPEFEAIVEGQTGCFFEYNNLHSLEYSISNFFKKNTDREIIRKNCYRVIDERYNPHVQLKIIKDAFGI